MIFANWCRRLSWIQILPLNSNQILSKFHRCRSEKSLIKLGVEQLQWKGSLGFRTQVDHDFYSTWMTVKWNETSCPVDLKRLKVANQQSKMSAKAAIQRTHRTHSSLSMGCGHHPRSWKWESLYELKTRRCWFLLTMQTASMLGASMMEIPTWNVQEILPLTNGQIGFWKRKPLKLKTEHINVHNRKDSITFQPFNPFSYIGMEPYFLAVKRKIPTGSFSFIFEA